MNNNLLTKLKLFTFQEPAVLAPTPQAFNSALSGDVSESAELRAWVQDSVVVLILKLLF